MSVKVQIAKTGAQKHVLLIDGQRVTYPKVIDHPQLGVTAIAQPVIGRTKNELDQRLLELIGYLTKRIQSP